MAAIKSIIDSGSGGTVITVECHMANSLPGIVIVGYANKSVAEAKERIRGALTNSGVRLPPKRIIFNLAPADIPKHGSSFDLPMLVAVLQVMGKAPCAPSLDTIVMGEAGLNGDIRPVRGIIGKILSAQKQGINKFWLPEGNLAQASLVPGVMLRVFQDVQQLYAELNGSPPKPPPARTNLSPPINRAVGVSFDDISGQQAAKRAMCVAAAGNHNILLAGPPGSGKSMLAKALPAIMPDQSLQEILETTHLHSLADKNFGRIVSKRPFRAPHHTASSVSILGGGFGPRPGEVSLSHNGILFFDEFPEFKRQIIESLRQPLEDKTISVARMNDSVHFPANFLFVAAANPCPCGFYGSSTPCSCSVKKIQNYQKKISGPVLDRIDIHVSVQAVPVTGILNSGDGSQTEYFKQRVSAARQKQLKRQGKLNCSLEGKELEVACRMGAGARQMLDQAAGGMRLSARAYTRSLKVARTIADLTHEENVGAEHIGEALQYREKAFG